MPKKTNLTPKRIAIAVVILAVLALVIYGIVVAIQRSSIPVFDDGSELSVVSLYVEGDSDSEWYITIEDTAIVEVVDIINIGNNTDDAKPEVQYVFKGKKAGRTNVTFRYGKFSDGKAEREQKYLIEVNENLETRITQR